MKKNFPEFLKFFPEIELPVTITEESILEFNKFNKALPTQLIEEFIIPIETEIDEYTEFVPCLQLKGDEFYAILYWRGMLLSYEYILVTFDKKGNHISRKIVSGTKVENENLIKSVCMIDEDHIIHIMVGGQKKEDEYDAQNSRAMNMEILASGDIIFSLQD